MVKHQEEKTKKYSEERMDDNNFNTPPRATMTAKGLQIPPTPFLNCLGFGTGVNVWAFNSQKSPWAVKNVRNAMQKKQKIQYQQLIDKEAKVLSTLNHKNIIGYRGLFKSLDGRHCLAMESGGKSLGELTEEREATSTKPFSPQQILKVVVGVANALHYLHVEKNLLHGDVKSYNILIKGDFDEIKLCDLGVCVPMLNGVASYYTGTLIYNAPEVVDEDADDPVITGKAEIFSLGLVMWEMMALSPPHCSDDDYNEGDEMTGSCDDSVIILDESIAKAASEPGTRPQLPDLGPEYLAVADLFRRCTEADPQLRPSALQLAQLADNLL